MCDCKKIIIWVFSLPGATLYIHVYTYVPYPYKKKTSITHNAKHMSTDLELRFNAASLRILRCLLP